MKQTISVLVENQAGVLNRITGLFSRRAFNIESLAVGVTDDPAFSRITIIVDSGNSVVEQVEKQLNKLIEVIKVRTIPEDKMIGRELVLLKVNATNKTRQDIMTICDIMGAKVDDISPNSLTLELSDTPDRIDTFEAMLRPFSILEVVRTGVIALQKGGGKDLALEGDHETLVEDPPEHRSRGRGSTTGPWWTGPNTGSCGSTGKRRNNRPFACG